MGMNGYVYGKEWFENNQEKILKSWDGVSNFIYRIFVTPPPINLGIEWVPVLSQGVPGIARPVKSSATLSQVEPYCLYDRGSPKGQGTTWKKKYSLT